MVLTSALVRADAVAAGGTLVFISSLSRYVGYPGAATYAATKEEIAHVSVAGVGTAACGLLPEHPTSTVSVATTASMSSFFISVVPHQ